MKKLSEAYADTKLARFSTAQTSRTTQSLNYVEMINLPNFLITVEEFQSLNLPLINNFKVQQGTQSDKQKKNSGSKVLGKHLR